jgi:Protein of unknown function (DUF3052)
MLIHDVPQPDLLKGDAPMAGYSGTPLAKKLGVKAGTRMFVDNGPKNYLQLLDPVPDDVTFARRLAGRLDLIHGFSVSAEELAGKLVTYLQRIADNGAIWVSWPKKAAKVPTDVTEDVIRALALPLGLVDVKVCAVDDKWSGLKLVIRVENRKS